MWTTFTAVCTSKKALFRPCTAVLRPNPYSEIQLLYFELTALRIKPRALQTCTAVLWTQLCTLYISFIFSVSSSFNMLRILFWTNSAGPCIRKGLAMYVVPTPKIPIELILMVHVKWYVFNLRRGNLHYYVRSYMLTTFVIHHVHVEHENFVLFHILISWIVTCSDSNNVMHAQCHKIFGTFKL